MTDEQLLEEVVENTRKKAIELVQRQINKACKGPTMSMHDLATNIVTDDFIKKFKELFVDEPDRSQT